MGSVFQMSLLSDRAYGEWASSKWKPNTERYNDTLQCFAEARIVCFMVAYALNQMVLEPSARDALREIVNTVVGPAEFSELSGK